MKGGWWNAERKESTCGLHTMNTHAMSFSTYDGDVVNGLRHGVGTYVDKEGKLSFTGEWDQGKRHGKVRKIP